MAKLRDEADAIAREPWFWPNYRTSKLSQAIERPLSDPSWQNGVLNAYAQTALNSQVPHD